MNGFFKNVGLICLGLVGAATYFNQGKIAEFLGYEKKYDSISFQSDEKEESKNIVLPFDNELLNRPSKSPLATENEIIAKNYRRDNFSDIGQSNEHSSLEKKLEFFLLTPDLTPSFAPLRQINFPDNKDGSLSISNPFIFTGLSNSFVQARIKNSIGLDEISIKSPYVGFSAYDYIPKENDSSQEIPGELFQVIAETDFFDLNKISSNKTSLEVKDLEFMLFKNGSTLNLIYLPDGLDSKGICDFIEIILRYNRRIKGDVFVGSRNISKYNHVEFSENLIELYNSLKKQ